MTFKEQIFCLCPVLLHDALWATDKLLGKVREDTWESNSSLWMFSMWVYMLSANLTLSAVSKHLQSVWQCISQTANMGGKKTFHFS